MCYHSFHQFEGRQLAGDTVITARGKAFRYESRYHTSLERLWDFTIREIVFMGTQEFAADCRDLVMRQAFALMEELELAGACEVANDPFFANGDTAGKIFSQRLMELKFELLLPVAADRSIAVGSFNLHGSFFGESFGIKDGDDRPIASGCAGFGLERLVHAFLTQHGSDPARWPAAVVREMV
jgi:seryl-tRNA synthetase